MKINDLIATSLKNLWRRKIRTLLTIIGVLIGSTSIIIMLSMGFALDKNNEELFEELGGLSIIEVYPSDTGFGNNSNNKNLAILNDATINKISKMEGVKLVIPKMNITKVPLYLSKGKYKFDMVTGVDFNKLKETDIKIGEGNFPKNEYESIAGPMVSEMFYDNNSGKAPNMPVDLLNDRLELSTDFSEENRDTGNITKKIKIIGLLDKPKGMDGYSVFVDIKYLKDMAKEINLSIKDKNKKIDLEKFSNLTVYTKKDADIIKIQEEIKSEGFISQSMAEEFNEIKNKSKSTSAMFFIVGIVAFIVAAIGIANTMIMSVYERTKEIGVMKVIGASINNIRNMFLLEATFIGLIGGIISIGISYLISILLNSFGSAIGNMQIGEDMNKAIVSIIPAWLPLVGVIFSTLVGLLSGYLPSRRATKISAIEAIRSQ